MMNSDHNDDTYPEEAEDSSLVMDNQMALFSK